MIDPSTVPAAPVSSRRFSALDLVDVESPRDDQSKLVDVDRLAVEIIGAHRDRLKRALARAVAGGDDDLGVGLQPPDFGQRGEALVGAVGVGRQAEVERDHRRLVRAQRLDRAAAVAGSDYTIAVVGPFQLALQPPRRPR